MPVVLGLARLRHRGGFAIVPSTLVLVLVTVIACGKDEKEPGAKILPVAGLSVPGLSLAAPEGRCDALRSFVEAFSAQHSPGVVRDARCRQNLAAEVVSLSFTFGKQGEAVRAGSAVVTLVGDERPIRLCSLLVRPGADSQVETSCFQVEGGAKGVGIPTSWRKDDLKIDDLIYSLQDYAGR